MCDAETRARPTADLLVAQARRLGRTVDAAEVERTGLDARLLGQAAEIGLFGLTLPEEHGGAGLSLGAACRVVEELAVFDRALATAVGLHAGLGTRAIVELGSDALRARLLPRMAGGQVIGAFAATEPEAGSDLAGVRTFAVPDGGALRLTGEKAYVTNGGFAGVFTVLCRTPGTGGERAVSLLAVPREAEGVAVGPEESKLGIRGSSVVAVRFDDVRVPLDHLLGRPGRGLVHAGRCLAWGRTLMAAGCVGTARAALHATAAHVRARRQFGQALGDLGAVRAELASMARTEHAMRAMVEHVACRAIGGGELERAAMAAKIFCSEGAFAVCDRAVQLHGAMGYLEPTGVARLLRDCRVTRIFEGANEVLLLRLGISLLAEGERAALDTGRPCEDPRARRILPAVEAAEAILASTLQWARKRYGVRAADHPLLSIRLAKAFVSLLAARAGAGRPTLSPESSALADAACGELLAEAHGALDAVFRVEEDEMRDRALTESLYRNGHHLPVWPCEEAGE